MKIKCADPVRKYVLDMVNTEQQQRWHAALCSSTSNVGHRTAHRAYMYTFSVSAGEVELRRFAIDHAAAQAVHKMLQSAGNVVDLAFPRRSSWSQHARELEGYFQGVFRREDAIASEVFKQNFGFDFAELGRGTTAWRSRFVRTQSCCGGR